MMPLLDMVYDICDGSPSKFSKKLQVGVMSY